MTTRKRDAARQAANYRHQLRHAQQANDQLSAKVTALERELTVTRALLAQEGITQTERLDLIQRLIE